MSHPPVAMDFGLPQIFHTGGQFLVYNKDHIIRLRRHRIVGQLVGSSPGHCQQIVTSSLPYHLSHYAACLAHEKKLATIHRLIKLNDEEIEQSVTNYEAGLLELQEQAEKDHFNRRHLELRRRNIETNQNQLGLFDVSKVKLTVSLVPVASQSCYRLQKIDDSELQTLFVGLLDVNRTTLFRDLYRRGFYVTSGSKFGCDFLAYPGDPILYHAKFALRIVPELADGSIDLLRVDLNELNALHRLCHTANKVVLFAVIVQSSLDDQKTNRVEYWSIKAKEYLGLESKSALIKYPIDGFNGHDGVSSNDNHSQFVRR